jgi:hypothetical protein
MSTTADEPFHTFPESRYQLCVRSARRSVGLLGWLCFAILHYQSEPHLSEQRRLCRSFMCLISLFHVFPWFLIMMGAKGDDDATLAWLIAAVLVEVALNLYLFHKTGPHRIYPRLGRRILFVYMVVLLGAGDLTASTTTDRSASRTSTWNLTVPSNRLTLQTQRITVIIACEKQSNGAARGDVQARRAMISGAAPRNTCTRRSARSMLTARVVPKTWATMEEEHAPLRHSGRPPLRS